MSEKIKVSELNQSTATNDSDLIMIVQPNADTELENFKQTRGDFLAPINTQIGNKVDKVSGKGLSTNDFTTALKSKLQGVETGAEVNIIEDIKVNNTSLPVSNKAVNIDLTGYYTKTEENSLLANKLDTSLKGAASGLAELDSNGKVPSSQLPSYVDDVIEGYYYNNKFYKEAAHTTEITGETGKIYVDLVSEKTYRWGGSAYVEISESLALGETSSTAYRGDRGKIAYDHASDNNKVSSAVSKALLKVGVTAQGHISATEAVTKSDLTGLGVEDASNKVTSINSSSTNDQYPSAKCVYDITKDLDDRVDLLEEIESMTDLTWEQIAAIVAQGKAKNYFKVGDELTEDWFKTISGTKTTYADTSINVVHIDDYTNDNSETKEGMYLEWKYTTPDGIVFCEPQALQIFDGTEGATDGLPAGKYCFYVDSLPTWNTARPVYAGKYLCFETTQNIPSGGLIRAKGQTIGNTASGWQIETRTSDQSNATTIETLDLTPQSSIPTGYTNLGTCWGTDIGYGKLNWIECLSYGDNTWRDSDIRQWLNSNAVAGEWWEKKTRYNIQPAYARTYNGFLNGYSNDFVNQMKTVKVGSYTNTRKEKEGLVYTYDKIFLRSNAQANCTTGDTDQDNVTNYPEGKVWDYYKALAVGETNLDANGRFIHGQTYEILKSYQLGSTSSNVTCWNRIAHRGTGNSVRSVSNTGSVYSYYACYAYRCRPACVI